MNNKLKEIEKELEEINKQLSDCVTRTAYLRGLLTGLNPENDAE